MTAGTTPAKAGRPKSGPPREAGRSTGLGDGLVLLAGLYLVIAPWLVGYGAEVRLVLSDMVCGLALLALGIAHAVAAGRMRPVSWVIPVIGAWVAVSPAAFYHADNTPPTAMVWTSNAVAGGLVVLVGILITVWPPSSVDR